MTLMTDADYRINAVSKHSRKQQEEPDVARDERCEMKAWSRRCRGPEAPVYNSEANPIAVMQLGSDATKAL